MVSACRKSTTGRPRSPTSARASPGHGAEGADGRGLHQNGDEAEDRRGQCLQEIDDRAAAVANQRKSEPEQHRKEQHLQDVALRKSAGDRVGNDVHQEADDAGVVRLFGVGRHLCGVERGRIDVHAGAGLDDIGDDETDDKRQRREHQEIDHRLAGDAAHLLQVGNAGDAGRHREEDHRRDHHLHQLDEGVAERLHRLTGFGIEVAEKHAGGDRRQHLHIEMPVERKFAARLGGSEYCLHDVLHCAPIESSTSRSNCVDPQQPRDR